MANNVATVTKTGNCITTITATISACGETYQVAKSLKVGLPDLGNYGNVVEGEPFCDGGSNAQCYSPTPDGAKTWIVATNMSNFNIITWTKDMSIPASPGGSIIWSNTSSGNTSSVKVQFKSANSTLSLKSKVTNSCGSITKYYCFYSTNNLCPPQMMMRGVNQTLKIYPNPVSAGNTVTLELFLEDEPIDFENSVIQLIDSKNKIVLEKQGTKEMKEQLNIPVISNGKYYITVTNSYGIVSEELIINNGR